jgi:hypothetical protein
MRTRASFSLLPTAIRTLLPTAIRTLLPTAIRTLLPTAIRTLLPTAIRTLLPTAIHTLLPTAIRTLLPTAIPRQICLCLDCIRTHNIWDDLQAQYGSRRGLCYGFSTPFTCLMPSDTTAKTPSVSPHFGAFLKFETLCCSTVSLLSVIRTPDEHSGTRGEHFLSDSNLLRHSITKYLQKKK